MARLAGIRERWGYWARGREGLLTNSVEPPAKKLHKIDYFLYLTEALGIASDGRLMEFAALPSAAAELKEILAKRGILPGDSYVVVHAGGNWNLKRWPEEYFAQWIYFILEKYGHKVLLCGSDHESEIAQRIIGQFPKGKVHSLCGKTSLDVQALLLKGAKLFLSNDSGPIHLAASQKTKLVGLYGPTSSRETGPVSAAPMKILHKDVGCLVPCYFKACDYRVCMDFLLPKEVFLESQALLETA